MKIIDYFERPSKCWFPKNLKKKIEILRGGIEVDIVSHCNLKCKGCTHFSPIADPWFINVDEFQRDMQRVSQLLPGEKIGRLSILGGEPLLHKDIEKIMVIARSVYPEISINVTTNGLLLPHMSKQFWEVCEQQRIEIIITKYPIEFDYQKIEDLMVKMRGRVSIQYYGRTKFMKKKQYRLPLDINGSQDGTENFRHCFMGGNCVNLSHGKLFTCSYAACMDRFNRYFEKNVPITEDDYVDIYQADNSEDVLKSLTSPIPLCSYCNVEGRTYGNEWGISKKELSEWAD